MPDNKALLSEKLQTNREGVDNSLIVIAFIVSLANAIKEAWADKKITVMEGISLGWFLFRNLTGVIPAFAKLDDELTDHLTDSEIALLMSEILKLEYLEDLDVEQGMVVEAAELVAKIKNFTYKWFIKKELGNDVDKSKN